MQVVPYLCFNGQCEAAFRFYEQCFGGQLGPMFRYGEGPMADQVPPDWQDKIMHAVFCVGPNAIMVSDGRYGQPRKDYSGFTLSIAAEDAQSGERIFNMLAEGGNILTPWQSTFWTQGFGMLTDRFGVPWLINVVHEGEARTA